MRIIDTDGSIQGWFVSLCITVSIFILIILGLMNDKIADRWTKVGGFITTIYLGQFGAWLAYKGVKIFSPSGKDNEVL